MNLNLTIQLYLVPRFGMSRGIHLLRLHALVHRS